MQDLAKTHGLIAHAEVLELGCGADYGLIPELTRRRISAVGIDLDLSGYNSDILKTEFNLRCLSAVPSLGTIGLSCYPHYPAGINNLREALEYIKDRLERVLPDGFDLSHYQLLKNRSVLPLMEQMPFGGLEISEAARKRTFEASAFAVLPDVTQKSLNEIYADYFLSNFEDPQLLDLLKMSCRVLAPCGRLKILEDVIRLERMHPLFQAAGFELESFVPPSLEDPLQSANIRGERQIKQIDKTDNTVRIVLKKV